MIDIESILALSNSEKIILNEKIWESIEKDAYEISDNQKKELDLRLKKYNEGKTKLYTWEQIESELNSLK